MRLRAPHRVRCSHERSERPDCNQRSLAVQAQPKVFIRHSNQDIAFAEQLVVDLRAAGADAWLDKTDLGAGDFQARISAALGDCEWFVVVLTRSALASKWVIQEVNAANALKHSGQIRDLIFIRAGPLELHVLPALWRVFNIFDATPDYEQARDQVLNTIGGAAHIAPPVQSTRVAPPLHLMREQLEESLSEKRDVELKLTHGQFAQALEDCDRFLTRHPDILWALECRTKALRGLGRDKEAQAAERRFLQARQRMDAILGR
jgi:hypothetical protein